MLSIRVISAQCLPKPENDIDREIIDPYVTVEIFGAPIDCQKVDWGCLTFPMLIFHSQGPARLTTTALIRSGTRPLNLTSLFPVGCRYHRSYAAHPNHASDLALVNIRVYDEDVMTLDDFVAQSAVPFHNIREGYSHLRMRTKGEKFLPNTTVFVYTSICSQGRELMILHAYVITVHRS